MNLMNPMNLLSLYLIDYNHLTRKDKAPAGWYAVIIFASVIAAILAGHWYGPSLIRVMEW